MKKLKLKKTIYVKPEGRKKVYAMDEKSGLYFICKDMAAEVVQILAKEGSRGGLTQAELKGIIFSKPKPTQREIDQLDLAVEEIKRVGMVVGAKIPRKRQIEKISISSALVMVSVIAGAYVESAEGASCVRDPAHDGDRWGGDGSYDLRRTIAAYRYCDCSYVGHNTSAICTSCNGMCGYPASGAYTDSAGHCPCIWT